MESSLTDINPRYADGPGGDNRSDFQSGEGSFRATLMAGIIGAVVASAGYLIYSRLEDEQREALRESVGKFVQDKMSDVRSQLKF